MSLRRAVARMATPQGRPTPSSAMLGATSAAPTLLANREALYMASLAAVAATTLTVWSKPGGRSLPAKAEANPAGLSPQQVMDMTSMLVERVQIPLVPAGIQEMVLGQAVEVVAKELPKRLTKQQMADVRKAMDGASDGISKEERAAIVKSVSGSLSAVPLVPVSMREALVGDIFDLLIGDASLSSYTVGTAGSVLAGTATGLLDAEGRKRLSARINEKIDLPGLSEEQEQAIFEKGIDLLGGYLEALIPPSWRTALQGASAEEIEAFKQNIMTTLDGKLQLPFVSEETRRGILRIVVDYMFDAFLDTSGLDGVVLSPEMQLAHLEKVQGDLKLEMETMRRAGARRQAAMKRRLERLEQQKAEIRRQLGHHGAAFYVLGAIGVCAAGALTYVCLPK